MIQGKDVRREKEGGFFDESAFSRILVVPNLYLLKHALSKYRPLPDYSIMHHAG